MKTKKSSRPATARKKTKQKTQHGRPKKKPATKSKMTAASQPAKKKRKKKRPSGIKNPTRHQSRFLQAVGSGGNFLLVLVFIFSILMLLTSKSDRSFFGYRVYTVLTNSMVPRDGSPSGGFYAGDLTLVQQVNPETLEKGDIITYRVGTKGTSYLTHRLVGKLEELNGEKGTYFVTQGDANDAKDPPFSANQVLGKVVFVVPKIGKVLTFVQAKENRLICMIFLFSILGFIWVLRAYIFSDS